MISLQISPASPTNNGTYTERSQILFHKKYRHGTVWAILTITAINENHTRWGDRQNATYVLTYMLNNLYSNHLMTIKQLAHILHTNEKKLQESFKRIYGKTIRQLHEELRRLLIVHLIIQSTIPLMKLSEDFGYSDYSTFSAMAKRTFGLYPRLLRQSA
ncbi:AraC family transcriptional regulator [Chitinophaga sp. S165]|uniref:helix-turn-helix domain-containing protein n=1 Tax=Chitinophaga sp. S165 TaxID=2135462 RepID=UPI000D714935|nr:AraC-like DNA-binding protein [Chitinophaga sp. S165]